MKNIAFINCTEITEYGFRKLVNGKSAFELSLEYAQSLTDVEKTVIVTVEDRKNLFESFTAEAEILTAEKIDNADLFDIFEKESSGFDYIFYMYGDCPFLDLNTFERMYKNHIRYFAQYSFADGNPYGTAPEILSTEIAGALKVLAEKNLSPVERDTVFKTIQKDINSFDIETDISEKDLRLLRISLTADSKRNFLLLERLASENRTTEKEIVEIIEEKGEILRTLPAYYQVQVSGKCFQKCSYCPYPSINPDLLDSKEFMSSEKFSIILDKIHRFSEDAVIALSLWGEPLANPELEEIIDAAMKYDKFSVLIETSGLGLDKQLASRLAEKYGNRITWIVSLDTDDMEMYGKIRGDNFSEAVESAEYLISVLPENSFVQAVRMNDTEEKLEQFFRNWKKKTENVIIQKYDNFTGLLEDKKVTDISPLKRFPCWHLKRDISVLINGDIPLCREDIHGKNILGNIFSSELDKIWEKGEKIYKDHLKNDFSGICRECDEYYTYNF